MMRMVDACFAGKLLIEGSIFNKDGCLNSVLIVSSETSDRN